MTTLNDLVNLGIKRVDSETLAETNRLWLQYILENPDIKRPCEICGTPPPGSGPRRIQGHHFDYSQWSSVIWLCSKHHKQLHRLIDRLDDQESAGVVQYPLI